MPEISLNDFNRVVHLIYQAAADPKLWPDLLLEISSHFGGTMMVMQGHDVVANASIGFLHTPVDPKMLEDYEQYYAARNVWVDGIAKMPVGRAGHPEDHLPYEDYIKSEFYNDWMKPLGDYGTASGIVLHRDHRRFLILSGNVRLTEADDTRIPLANLLNMLAPHISRSFKLMRYLPSVSFAQDYRTTVEFGLDPVYVIDQRGRVVFANSHGDALRLTGTTLHLLKGGRLRLLDSAADAAFDRALTAIVETDYQLLKGEFSVRTTDGSTLSAIMAPLYLHAAKAPAVFDQIFEDRPVAILVLRMPKVLASSADFSRGFELTVTELALAQAIASGLSPQEIADRRGVSINTVRTQLKSIYFKTGMRRQSQIAGVFRQT